MTKRGYGISKVPRGSVIGKCFSVEKILELFLLGREGTAPLDHWVGPGWVHINEEVGWRWGEGQNELESPFPVYWGTRGGPSALVRVGRFQCAPTSSSFPRSWKTRVLLFYCKIS